MTITLNGRKLAFLALAVLAILAAYILGSGRSTVANAATPTVLTPTTAASAAAASTSGITVTGTGKVTGTPDTLRISLSINATSTNIDDALAQANKSAAAVQSALKDRGVDAKDMQTSGLSIQPNYTQKGAPDGYAVSESLTASIRNLDKAGSTLSAAVAAGGKAVRVDGVSVALDNTSSLLVGARTSAIDDAKAKATQYAQAAGRTLGDVVSISEVVSNPTPVNDMRFAAQASAAVSAVPIQAGSQDVSVDVTVVYAIA
jgi:uncharacterized protein YggE